MPVYTVFISKDRKIIVKRFRPGVTIFRKKDKEPQIIKENTDKKLERKGYAFIGHVRARTMRHARAAGNRMALIGL